MLSLREINEIEKQATGQRRINDLGDKSPIGMKIFNYLENLYESYILLYPLKSRKVAAFTRKQNETTHIFINTSFNVSYQVFVAAHELYHLINLREKRENKFIVCNEKDVSEGIDETQSDIEEIKANYFAAAFLLPKKVIEERFYDLKGRKYLEEDLILKIIELQFEYEIPYKTVLRRLNELEVIDKKEFEKLNIGDKQIQKYYKILDSEVEKRIRELEKPNKRKYHTLNVPKMAFDIYRDSFISIGKFESIISKYDKNLDDFNVARSENKPIDIDFSNFWTGGAIDDKD